MNADLYSPWPDEGHWIKFQIKPRYAITTTYNGKWPLWTLRKKWSAIWGPWPFISIKIKKIGFYFGWKPITLQDHQFDVPIDFPRDAPACEFSFRFTNS